MTASNEITSEVIQTNMTETVGICMSGGGYRAAAFHFGTLAYLEKLGLNAQIKALSTVSGGTFTGAKYVLSQIEHQHFSSFFKEYYNALNMTNLVADGFLELTKGDSNVASGRQNLIVSMAQVYAETFFCKPKQQAPYYFSDVLSSTNCIENVVFNATDFRSGLAFRFQKTTGYEGLIGNHYNNINKEDAANIRLADIVAASSCFPGGFEPISFPYDFSWKKGQIPPRITKEFPFERDYSDPTKPMGPIGLMDGGVYDNQGLQSLLMVEEQSKTEFDLLVISDVDQPNLSLYDMPAPGTNGGLTLNTVSKGAVVFVVLCAIALLTIGYHTVIDIMASNWSWKLLFLYLIPFSVTAVAAGTVYIIYTIIQDDVLPHIPVVGERSWRSIRKLTIGQVRNMLKLRISSLLTLTTSVFMKRIRSLVYGLAYSPSGDKNKVKRVSNVIYSLSPAKTQKEPLPGVGQPSALLRKVACVAFNQSTSLWFDKPYQLPSLIAAGQASLCYNMLKLFARRNGTDPEHYPPAIKAQYDIVLADWRSFNKTPFCGIGHYLGKHDWTDIIDAVEKVECDWGMFEQPTSSLKVVNMSIKART